MKLSVFTPTHDPKFLLEAYESLKKQAHQEWEWLILPNGQKVKGTVELPEAVTSDSRVKVLPYTTADGIGCLKKLCCLQATGEVLVELDHDDYFTPDAFKEIIYARKRHGADFIYSDCAHFFHGMDNSTHPDHSSEVFPVESGWEHYSFPFQDRTYTVMKCFEPDARSLCEIFWSPNHVRCWSREAYEALGGHSGRLSVGDDHDLMCRTYLGGFKFHHIVKPIYMYRRTKTNSFVIHNAEVQAQQQANKDKYTPLLVQEWCRRKDLRLIDLGGGHDCLEGYESLDMDPSLQPKICCDLLDVKAVDKLIDDNSVGAFRAQDFLEHIPVPSIPAMWNTLYRKLAPGGWILSGTPAVAAPDGTVGLGAWQDPTHVSQWSANNFWYVTMRQYARYCSALKCRFQTVHCVTNWPSKWHKENRVPYLWWHGIALKGQRCPGVQLI